VSDLIRDADEIFVSVASLWELSIKAAKIPEKRPLIPLAEKFKFALLPVLPHHAVAIIDLPQHHRDPFDHLLLAQANVEGLTLVTHDRILSEYGVPVLLV
jgi:PIN domain nuclease of toxin-antitoxin system